MENLGIHVKMVSIDYEPEKLHELYLHIQGILTKIRSSQILIPTIDRRKLNVKREPKWT